MATKLEYSLPAETSFNQDTSRQGLLRTARVDILPPTLSENTFPRCGL